MAGNWAGALEALGAGLQGKGNEYMLVQEEQKKRQEELSQERKKAWILDMDQAVSLAEAGDVGGAQALLQNRIENVDRLNGDPQHSAGMLRLLQEGKVNEFVAGARPIVERGKVEFGLNGPDEPSNVREWEYYSKLNPEQQVQYLEMKRAQQLIDTGGGAKAVVRGNTASPVTGSQNQTVDQFREEYAGAEANLAASKSGAETAADLSAQWKLKPSVDAAVRKAVADVERAAEVADEERSNERAYRMYSTAMDNLGKALGATSTGPLIGWLPAMTNESQAAAGAIAVMAPVLKQLFRTSGEGNFSDGDQRVLMETIPTRQDLPRARQAKILYIDSAVRAKLAPGGESVKLPSLEDIEYTAKKHNMTVEQVLTKLREGF